MIDDSSRGNSPHAILYWDRLLSVRVRVNVWFRVRVRVRVRVMVGVRMNGCRQDEVKSRVVKYLNEKSYTPPGYKIVG